MGSAAGNSRAALETSAELEGLIGGERRALAARTAESRAHFERASQRLPGGVASDFQGRRPYPIYLASGQAGRVTDVDGNVYVDLHAAAGAALVGHGHPAVAASVERGLRRGACFAAPTLDAVAVADALAERFALPLWRPTNSGTEATMGAIRLARATTGRDLVVKLTGAYHGHHDSVLVEMRVQDAAERGHRAEPGVPSATAALTVGLEMNDVAALSRLLAERGSDVACVVIEPPMLTPTLVPPAPSYLLELRELCDQHGAMLLFDEVKTGIAVHHDGARGLFGVVPDLVALGKSFGGGLAVGAIGGSGRSMDGLARGEAAIYGTFNGNPVAMSAAEATLREIMTADAHRQVERHARSLCEAVNESAAAVKVPLRAESVGAKGALRTFEAPPRNVADWRAGHDPRLAELVWVWCMNRGVYLSPAPDGRWTTTVGHTDDDLSQVCKTVSDCVEVLGQLDWRNDR